MTKYLPWRTGFASCVAVTAMLAFGPIVYSATGGSITPIDIATWKSPVSAILKKRNVTLQRAEFEQRQVRTYRLFVKFKYDPQSSETSAYFDKLYGEIFEALKGAPFVFVDAEDGINIYVHQEKPSSSLSINIDPITPSQ